MDQNKEESKHEFTNDHLLDKEVVDDTDERSVFVKNVDFSAEPQELKDHFKECGEIKRITILFDKVM